MDHNIPHSRPPQPHLSPRRDLQLHGPRPSPLRVSKDSRKIMKPPQPPQPREPVIIYTISPKVIHVEPANFMDLVQRLTGPNNADPSIREAGAASPAARLANIHKTMHRAEADRPMASSASNVLDHQLERTVAIPGILSPVPASLPPISPAFFSPSTYLDPSFQSFLHDMSPEGFQVGRPSPGNFVSPFVGLSPGAAAWDIFNQFRDL